MSIVKSFSDAVLKTWLNELGLEHYLCDECRGLHLVEMQSKEGVAECRLFAEEWGFLLSTEFQIRPSALMTVLAEIGPLNVDYPTLKIFLDTEDDGVPYLVASATAYTGAGMTEGQFALFVTTSLEMTNRLLGELAEMNCLYLEEDAENPAPASMLH
ncbi:MAG: histidine kinase [Porticoccaceae bacterium]|nr:MAG: histidine kinase [Porticoccaceae bacterium]